MNSGQLGVGRPGDLEKLFDLVAMRRAKVFGKERIGLDDLVVDEFLKTHLDHVENQPMRQTRECNREPARPAGPEPLAAMIRLFTRPGKFSASDSAILPPME